MEMARPSRRGAVPARPPVPPQNRDVNLLTGARYPARALRSDNGWICRASDVRYCRRGKPRRGKARPRRVAAIKVGVLNVQAGAENVGLDLPAHVIKDINASVD